LAIAAGAGCQPARSLPSCPTSEPIVTVAALVNRNSSPVIVCDAETASWFGDGVDP